MINEEFNVEAGRKQNLKQEENDRRHYS